MSQCMLTATIAVVDQEDLVLNFSAGRAALDTITDAADFGFTAEDDLEAELDGLIEDDEDIDDPADRLKIFRRAGLEILDDLEALNLGRTGYESSEIDYIRVAGYRIFITGGMSSGDAPTDAAETLWSTSQLPAAVLSAIGFVTSTMGLSDE